jgi:spermidine dehydrogenase
VVTAKADYSKLDRDGSRVRIRLNSIALRVQHAASRSSGTRGAGNAGGANGVKGAGVEVIYSRGGKLYRARGAKCVLACWNMMIPYLCPELPEAQKSALHQLIKTPLVYASVALKNWKAFQKLSVREVYAPGSYFSSFELNNVVDIGAYRSPRSPDEPILIRMQRTPAKPGLGEREQHRVGRAELLATPFETFERHIREQLSRTLGAGGFDPARDIEGIAVNRWPHGYAPEYNCLVDGDTPPNQRPNIIGRAKFGNITIANSDAGMAAYTDSAINEAHRAVNELLKT